MDLSPVFVLALLFFLLAALRIPIAYGIGIATVLTMAVYILAPANPTHSFWYALTLASQQMCSKMTKQLENFTLICIPFFILAGMLMGKGGLAQRLIDLANVLVGWIPGGLALVNVLSCMFFGAISGAATAAASSTGSFLIPLMEKENYGREYSTALTVCSSTLGLLIPPSNAMIVYAVAQGNISIAAIFIAGFLPGALMGLGLMAMAAIIAQRRCYGTRDKHSFSIYALWTQLLRACPSLLLVIIVLGGILGGYFHASEAAVIAVLYTMVLTMVVYRNVSFREFYELVIRCGIITAFIMFLVAVSLAMGWVLTYLDIPQGVSKALVSTGISVSSFLHLPSEKIVVLLMINIILIIVGMFMDQTPAILIFTPIFIPVSNALGMHPIHFGLIMITNLCIGLCTPPVGTVLFVGCGIGNTTVTKITKPLLPFFFVMILILLVITYVPESWIMWLPHLCGYN
ncbi:MAG: TRAP transporter large permease [Planctomycetota bacterium]|nr:MAG: TRAP transporter large permease [Planctomycetota bacterium]